MKWVWTLLTKYDRADLAHEPPFSGLYRHLIRKHNIFDTLIDYHQSEMSIYTLYEDLI
jgi:hypothetical protein